jgi:hypothetical protein
VIGGGDLVARSPADGGLPPYELDALLDRVLARPLAAEQDVVLEDFEPSDRPVGVREA